MGRGGRGEWWGNLRVWRGKGASKQASLLRAIFSSEQSNKPANEPKTLASPNPTAAPVAPQPFLVGYGRVREEPHRHYVWPMVPPVPRHGLI
jgi:hypothetical protein